MEAIVFIIMFFTMLTGLAYLYYIFLEQFSALRRARRRRAQIIADLESGYIKQ